MGKSKEYTTSCKHKCKHTCGNWYNMCSTWGSVDLVSQCTSCKCYRYWVNKKKKIPEKTVEVSTDDYYDPDAGYGGWGGY